MYVKNIYIDLSNNENEETTYATSVYTLLDNHVKDISENLWRILNDAPKAFDTLNEVGTFLMDVSDNVFIQINQDIRDISSRFIWEKNGNDIVIETGNVGIGTTNPQAMLHINDVTPPLVDLEIYNYSGANSTTLSKYTFSQTHSYFIDKIMIEKTGSAWSRIIRNKNKITSGEYILEYTYYSNIDGVKFEYNIDGALDTTSTELTANKIKQTVKHTFSFSTAR